ncbi:MULTISPECIES: hypothetical protein [Sinorhizobium]|nr:hypothetical protein U8C39_22260 [Sinorhizobium meliloti]WQP21725.1 hypothetical protein U8C33_22385 [Sinorhizobium meliloti]WQP35141.1 hypothetical protein U8C45_22220 [Sinorhizobium meliloti]
MNPLAYSTQLKGFDEFRPDLVKGTDVVPRLDKIFEQLREEVTRAYHPVVQPTETGSFKDKLYESRAAFKIYASKVSMHLGRDWLHRLFAQIDSLLDADEWDPEDPPPQLATAQTLIRMLLTLKVERKPGLGISPKGNLVAAWTLEKNRLTVECLSNDRVRWVLSRVRDDEVERAAGEGKIDRLREFIEPYDPEIWFTYGK